MVLKKEAVMQRLKELDTVIQELGKYENIEPESLKNDLSQRWVIERGLEAGAQLILEIGDHILSGHFGLYIETYEDILRTLLDRNVISEELYLQIKGLGGFRNILVHQYIGLDLDMVFNSFHKSLRVFPLFAQEILAWMAEMEQET